jgi:hypothetical protein
LTHIELLAPEQQNPSSPKHFFKIIFSQINKQGDPFNKISSGGGKEENLLRLLVDSDELPPPKIPFFYRRKGENKSSLPTFARTVPPSGLGSGGPASAPAPLSDRPE